LKFDYIEIWGGKELIIFIFVLTNNNNYSTYVTKFDHYLFSSSSISEDRVRVLATLQYIIYLILHFYNPTINIIKKKINKFTKYRIKIKLGDRLYLIGKYDFNRNDKSITLRVM